jgi:hypothetical protein
MQGLTVAEMSAALGLSPKTIKSRLTAAAIKPREYAGPTGIYEPEALEKIREVQPPGRPKRKTGE